MGGDGTHPSGQHPGTPLSPVTHTYPSGQNTSPPVLHLTSRLLRWPLPARDIAGMRIVADAIELVRARRERRLVAVNECIFIFYYFLLFLRKAFDAT